MKRYHLLNETHRVTAKMAVSFCYGNRTTDASVGSRTVLLQNRNHTLMQEALLRQTNVLSCFTVCQP
jgi:hypothetical protein